MAQPPAHRFGQIIGDVLEAATLPLLESFASEHNLYLDRKGPRPCRRGKKCSWLDLNGNSHDLDFVLERGGSADKFGIPVAFIETAWRRYTKHSRNKVQEIQGAVLPLAETHRHSSPFKGAIVAGVFTDGALTQLKSLGFAVLYFPYDSVVAVFRRFGIDARFTETTADADFQIKVDAYQALSMAKRNRLAAALIKAHSSDVRQFIESLSLSVSRQIDRLIVLALHGKLHEALTMTMQFNSSNGTATTGARSRSTAMKSKCGTTMAIPFTRSSKTRSAPLNSYDRTSRSCQTLSNVRAAARPP